MVVRIKQSPTFTRLTGGRPVVIPPVIPEEPVYWEGSCAAEPASTSATWTAHTRVPTLVQKDDPDGVFTPIAGGIQFNYPGVYQVEVNGQISGGAAGGREGIEFYTSGSIIPAISAFGAVVGGELMYLQSVASNRHHTSIITVTVEVAGATVKMQDYHQSATSHTCTVTRIRATKVMGGGPGPEGPQGDEGDIGPQGIPGSRWGSTGAWLFTPTLANCEVSFPDGLPPRVGDLVVTNNGFEPGAVYAISAVVDATHADLEVMVPHLNIRGAVGPAGPAGDAPHHWPIDSVYISFSSANPAALFGGTWVSVGTGRMLIGVDPADASMDAPGDTGGTKTVTLTTANLPPHNHSINHDHGNTTISMRHASNTNVTSGTAPRVIDIQGITGGGGTAANITINVPSYTGNSGVGPGTSDPVNNLPPFLAVYMWRRTA